jgi:hypothetical protein
MKNRSPAFNAYIAKAAPFARPILQKLRELFHEACPDIEETMKWSHPHFDYRGLVGGMAAFKQHVSFGFWKGKLLKDPHGLFSTMENAGMSGAIEWLTEAKQEATRDKRLATAIEWIAEGKPRNWKYMKK